MSRDIAVRGSISLKRVSMSKDGAFTYHPDTFTSLLNLSKSVCACVPQLVLSVLGIAAVPAALQLSHDVMR